MSDEMTLREALETDEVKSIVGDHVREAIADLNLGDVVREAVTEQLPTLRESVASTLRESGQVRDLHAEALRLIEAAPLKGAAKQNLLDDYALLEPTDGGDPRPGRALALVEAEMDADGTTVKKTATQVLRESVEADVKRIRNVLRESSPSFPVSPGGGGDGGEDPPAVPEGGGFLQESSAAGAYLREKGLDLTQFGMAPPPTTPA